MIGVDVTAGAGGGITVGRFDGFDEIFSQL